VVGNDVDATDRALVMVTGANQGGKTTFLRSVGLAQLMTQCGMFVPAERLRTGVATALFTHFRRGEDASMRSGKLDEELARLSRIVDELRPGALVLFNESFASTNEREGSQIAQEVVHALLDAGVRVLFVTHLYDLAASVAELSAERTRFLRAERREGGQRTYRLLEGAPLPTSHGEDLYEQVFGSVAPTSPAAEATGEAREAEHGGA
jgi:DNA mismatch repair ATPase MutS